MPKARPQVREARRRRWVSFPREGVNNYCVLLGRNADPLK
jgi:hypothetical protein